MKTFFEVAKEYFAPLKFSQIINLEKFDNDLDPEHLNPLTGLAAILVYANHKNSEKDFFTGMASYSDWKFKEAAKDGMLMSDHKELIIDIYTAAHIADTNKIIKRVDPEKVEEGDITKFIEKAHFINPEHWGVSKTHDHKKVYSDYSQIAKKIRLAMENPALEILTIVPSTRLNRVTARGEIWASREFTNLFAPAIAQIAYVNDKDYFAEISLYFNEVFGGEKEDFIELAKIGDYGFYIAEADKKNELPYGPGMRMVRDNY